GRNAVVTSDGGLRINRLPERATLGRRARERRVAELRATELTTVAALELEVAELQRNSNAFDQSEQLMRDLDILASGDPADEIETQNKLVRQQTALESENREQAKQQKVRVAELRERGKRLRELAGDAWLL